VKTTFLVVLFLDSCHLLAPIALAWGNAEFRLQMLVHRVKFVVLPALVLIVASSAGVLTLTFWRGFHLIIIGTNVQFFYRGYSELINPFACLAMLFVVWNVYHFGAQNFGLWRLWHRKGRRSLQKTVWVGGTAIGMIGAPIAFPILAPVSLWAFGLSHWLAAVGLAAKASRGAVLFCAAMLLSGGVIAASVIASITFGSLLVQMTVLSGRAGLGIVHFLYDRWVWKLSDPRVRATISRHLFCDESI
jgi:hypothetical protein